MIKWLSRQDRRQHAWLYGVATSASLYQLARFSTAEGDLPAIQAFYPGSWSRELIAELTVGPAN